MSGMTDPQKVAKKKLQGATQHRFHPPAVGCLKAKASFNQPEEKWEPELPVCGHRKMIEGGSHAMREYRM